MSVSEYYRSLEDAKWLALSGEYQAALACIEDFLVRNPRDVEGLRFKGNVIELEILDRAQHYGYEFSHSPETLKARICYEQALLLQPNHSGVLADLGTHWKNIGDNDKAIEFFDKVIALLSNSSSNPCYEIDDYVEALEGKMEILEEKGDFSGAKYLQQQLKLLEP